MLLWIRTTDRMAGNHLAKLTDGNGGTIAKAALPEKGQRFIFDDHRKAPRGFGLRITAAGGKAFVLKYTLDGRDRRMTLGDWPTWSLEAARERAAELRRQIDTGLDPLDAKRRRKAEPTVAEAVAAYCKSHVAGLKSETAIIRYFERDLVPELGRVKVADVTRRDLIELVEAKAAATPTAARHLLAYLKGLFDWCVDREYIEVSPAVSIKPKSIKGGKKDALKPVARRRTLDNDELKTFWHSSETCGIHKLTAIALKLVLVTGQRPGEVAGMTEAELHGSEWVIPQGRRLKTETEQRVPLTPLALDLIEQAREEVLRLNRRRKREASGLIFETRPGCAVGVGALSKAVGRYAEALGNKEHTDWGQWRPHDLRRTCRTGLSACGIPQEIAERVIGHADAGIIQTYNQHQYDAEKRTALEAWARRLTAIVQGGDPDKSNVLPIGKRA